MAKKTKLPPVIAQNSSGSEEKAQYWLKQIAMSSKNEADWRKTSGKVWKLYRNAERSKNKLDSSYNILYANVEVLRGALYQKLPVPEVRRRFRDKDPVGRVAAEVLDRALTYSMDAYDFHGEVEQVVLDRLLPGRGLAYVKYVPTFQPQEPADPGATQSPTGDATADPTLTAAPEVIYEEVRCEYVPWDMFRYSPGAKRWGRVKWVAFGDVLDRDDLKKRFPATWDKVSLNYKAGDENVSTEESPFPDDEPGAKTGRALVWMIWSKVDKRVYWVSPGYTEGLLGQKDDPLKLEGFYPCPRPMYGQWSNDTLVPTPDYVQYQDQAEELNTLSKRLIMLVDALRRNGVYDSNFPELRNVLSANDNTFVAVENYSALAEKGGVEKTIYEMPIEGISKVVQNLYAERQQCIQAIYDITGISDLVRGQTNPNETLGAQQLKSNYSNVRIGPQQREVQRFVRDLLRLKGEIIAEHFSPKTLQLITGIQLPTAQQKQAQQMAAQAAQQQGQSPPPVSDEPTWDDVMGLLKSEKLRGTRIDIETDSTLVLNEAADKQAMAETVNAVGLAIQSLTPAVEGGVLSKEAASEILMSIVRQSGFGYRVEEAIEAAPPQPPPDPAAQAQQEAEIEFKSKSALQSQKGQQDAQLEQLRMQHALQLKQMENEHALNVERLRSDKEQSMEGMRHKNKLDVEFLKGTAPGMAGDGSKAALPEMFQQMAQAIQQMGSGLQTLAQHQQAQEQQIGILGQAVQTLLARMTAPKRFVYDQNGQLVGREVAGFGTEAVQRDASGKIVGTGSVQ